MPVIKDLKAIEIYDSRGFPTVECYLTLDAGQTVRASVPSGASTGQHEAVELRDGGDRLYGRGVRQVVHHIEQVIAPQLVGRNWLSLEEVDQQLLDLDGTANKSKLGANAILAVSMAAARALAQAGNQSLHTYLADQFQDAQPTLPVPLMNILNGGVHANNSLDIQEFMIAPVGASTFAEAMEMGCSVYHALKKHLSRMTLATSVGDEGGFAPNLPDNESAFSAIVEAIKAVGLRPHHDVCLAVDVAASELYHHGCYTLSHTNRSYTSDEWMAQMQSWIKKFKLISVEDAMAEDDWHGWRLLTKSVDSQVQLVGDDLFVTHTDRLKKGIDQQCANSILVKMNQVGTVSESLNTMNLARQEGYATVVSHRSGETNDDFIVDLAVATAAPFIKTGAPCRGERLAKYNSLLRYESLYAFPYVGRACLQHLASSSAPQSS